MGKASKNKNKSKKIRRSQRPDPPVQPSNQQPRNPAPLIETTGGVEAFLEDRPNFLEEMIESLESLRTKILATEESFKLRDCYALCGHVASKASPGAFAKIPELHLDLWLDHASGVFNELSTNDQWMSTGRLQLHDLELLDTVKLFAYCRTSFVVRKSFLRFLQVLADWCAAFEAPQMPCNKIAEHIRTISSSYVFRLMMAGKKEGVAFRTLADHGILAQTLRCFNASPISEIHLSFLDLMATSWTNNRRIFRHGTQTGDMLSTIMEGRDSDVSPWNNIESMKYLETIAKLRDYAKDDPNDTRCFQCFRDTLEDMVCARCHHPRYCSKACQRADWPNHKKMCGFGGPVKNSDWQSYLVQSWRKKHSKLVMAELDRVIRQRNVLTLKEVFLELDFMVCEGVAPALKDPPEFKVKLVNEFTPGHRQAAPDWWFGKKGKDWFEGEIPGQVKNMQICLEKMSDRELLVYSRFDRLNLAFSFIVRGGGGAFLKKVDTKLLDT